MQRFTRGGLINLKDAEAALLFSGTKTSISFDHYVDLLESFDIALRLDNNKSVGVDLILTFFVF